MLRLWHAVWVFSQSRGEDMKKYRMAVHHCEVGTHQDYVDYGLESVFSRIISSNCILNNRISQCDMYNYNLESILFLSL